VFSADNPAAARKARQIGLGRKSAARMRALGFPNLVLARAALANKRAAAKQHAAAAADQLITPFPIGKRPRGF